MKSKDTSATETIRESEQDTSKKDPLPRASAEHLLHSGDEPDTGYEFPAKPSSSQRPTEAQVGVTSAVPFATTGVVRKPAWVPRDSPAIPSPANAKKWWHHKFLAISFAFFYLGVSFIFVWILSALVVRFWWFGTKLPEAIIGTYRNDFILLLVALGFTWVFLFQAREIASTIEQIHFGDNFQQKLSITETHLGRTALVTLFWALTGLVFALLLDTLHSNGEIPVTSGNFLQILAGGIIGFVATTRTHWPKYKITLILAPILLAIAASFFFSAFGYIIASREARYAAAWTSAVLGAYWAILFSLGYANILPTPVRVRFHQISHVATTLILGIVGFYALDYLRSVSYPEFWNIPTQIHLLPLTNDWISSWFSFLGSFVWAFGSAVVALLGLGVGLLIGMSTDSSTHSLDLGKVSIAALASQNPSELTKEFTHWPKTPERNWVATLIVGIVYFLGGYLVLVGALSLVATVAMIVLTVLAAILKFLFDLVVAIITAIVTAIINIISAIIYTIAYTCLGIIFVVMFVKAFEERFG